MDRRAFFKVSGFLGGLLYLSPAVVLCESTKSVQVLVNYDNVPMNVFFMSYPNIDGLRDVRKYKVEAYTKYGQWNTYGMISNEFYNYLLRPNPIGDPYKFAKEECYSSFCFCNEDKVWE